MTVFRNFIIAVLPILILASPAEAAKFQNRTDAELKSMTLDYYKPTQTGNAYACPIWLCAHPKETPDVKPEKGWDYLSTTQYARAKKLQASP